MVIVERSVDVQLYRRLEDEDGVCIGSTPHSGCQWQIKVYWDSLLKM